MNRYRVNIEVAGKQQIRTVRAKSAEWAAHRARHLVVGDGWSPEHIGAVRAENEGDSHDYWESKRPTRASVSGDQP